MFRKKAWNPYFCGIIIGLLQIPGYLFAKAFLGTSTSYVTVSGRILGFLGIQSAGFSKYLSSEKFEWQLALVVGIMLGAFLSSYLSGLRRRGPSPVWSVDYSQRKRYPIAFFGGFLLLFGARLAGGCTSGHGISGAAQFSVSSWIAVALMFAAGIGFTAFLRRRACRTS